MIYEFLQKQKVIGPFTKSEEITSYLENSPDSKEKDHCMYRYASKGILPKFT